MVHRGLNQTSTEYINNMFNLASNNSGIVTRSEIRGDVGLPHYRLEHSKGNIAYRAAKYYNSVPKS